MKYEIELEEACCLYARSKGAAAVKLENTGMEGIPDRMFIKQGGDTLFVEFKAPTKRGVLSKEQIFWRNFLFPKCLVCDSYELFVTTFDKFIKKKEIEN